MAKPETKLPVCEAITLYAKPVPAKATVRVSEKLQPGRHVYFSVAGAEVQAPQAATPEATLKALADRVNGNEALRKVVLASVREATRDVPAALVLTARVAGVDGNKIPLSAPLAGGLVDEGFGTLTKGANEWWFASIIACDGEKAVEYPVANSHTKANAFMEARAVFLTKFAKGL